MNAEIIQPLLHWVNQHPDLALAAVFLTAFLECLALIGLFLPGIVLMFIIGAIIASGALPLVPTLLWASAGAIVGDVVSFGLGRHFKQRLHVIWPFRKYPSLLGRGTKFFHRHGGKSVFLSRFLGPIRPILPAVAGMLNMPTLRFVAIDSVSGLLWSIAYILPGVVFGASLHLATEVAGRLAILLVMLLVVLWFSLWLVRRMVRAIQPQANIMLGRLLQWSREHPYIKPLAGALLDPEHPEARGLFALAGIWLLASALFALTLTGILGGAPLQGIDQYIFHLLQGLRTPFADTLMVLATEMGDPLLRNSIFLAALGWLIWTRHSSAAIHWCIAYLTVAVVSYGLKALTEVPRPVSMYEGISAFSFPSIHASMSVALYGFLAVMIAGEIPPARRWIPYGLAALIIIPIGFSRLYLGAHWFSDILGGITLAIGWVTLLGVAYRRHNRPRIKLTGLIAVVLLTFVASSIWQAKNLFQKDLDFYALTPQTTQLVEQEWRTDRWQDVPAFRNDTEGLKQHPLTIQWFSDIESIKLQLESLGWHEPQSLGLRNILIWLAPGIKIQDLPVLPQVHDGRHEVLRMVRGEPEEESLLVLRLWRSNFTIGNNNRPLWTGNVSRLTTHNLINLITLLHTDEDFDKPLELLIDDLEHYEMVHRQITGDTPTGDVHALIWNGSVILLDQATENTR